MPEPVFPRRSTPASLSSVVAVGGFDSYEDSQLPDRAQRRLTYQWFALPEPAWLKAAMKGRTTSNPVSRFLLPAVRSGTLPASSFVPWKPVEIGEPGTREFFSLALARLHCALQMALQ
jgi:hypothetical protein